MARALRLNLHFHSLLPELMQRVYEVDVLTCQHCGGRRKVLEFLTKPSVVRKILAHLGLPTEPPPIAPARGPPEPALPFA